MNNLEIAQIFKEIARILEIKGSNPFRIRAYERAAQNIQGLSVDLALLVKEEKLKTIPGIGDDLAGKIKELILTGELQAYEKLKATLPLGFLDLLKIPSLGPKTAKLLYDQLKIKNIKDLENAIKEKRLDGIFGIKEKTIENLIKGIELLKQGEGKMSLALALQVAEPFILALKKIKSVKAVSLAGSLRRQKETVRDIDLLVACEDSKKVSEAFTELPLVSRILAHGSTKSSVISKDGIQVDLRVVRMKSFGAALLYFTGSKNFNIHLRKLAIKRKVKINEYGIFRKDKYLLGKSEEEIFKFLGLSFIEPELREDAGEIESAAKSSLPKLITLEDLKGDLHVHSNFSDGGNSIEEMAEAAKKCGYSYIAITDHSVGLKIAGGLSLYELKKKRAEIDRINKRMKNFKILYATEVDIDSQGKLDYKDEVLKDFDLVVAAIHSGFKQPKEQLTNRLIKACRNKYVQIIAHPTGRLFGSRPAYNLDWDQVLKAAKQTNTALEINAFPNRMDLNDIDCRRAKENGVKIAISTDAHATEQLDLIKLGISVARRGWLTKKDVINTLPLDKLLATLKK